MAVTTTLDEPFVDPWPVQDRGSWLVEHRWAMDRGECSWLLALADFDLTQGRAADGRLSAVA